MIYDPDQPEIEYIDTPAKIPPKIIDVQSELIDADLVVALNKPPMWNPVVVILCWSIIFVISSGLAILAFVASQQPEEQPSEKANLMSVNMAVKMEIGRLELAKNNVAFQNAAAGTTPGSINSGSVHERYCQVALIGEKEGPAKALQAISSIHQQALKHNYEFNDDEKQLEHELTSIYGFYLQGTYDGIADSQREFLTEQLGYSGMLVQYPEQTKYTDKRAELIDKATTMVQILTGVSIFAFLCVIGSFASWIGFSILTYMRKIKPQTPNASGRGQVYLESFTLWLIAFVGSQIIAAVLVRFGAPMLLASVASAGSLLALVWPIARGVPFKTMCSDIGLEFKNPFRECAIAFGCYLMVLPALLIGIIGLTLVTSGIQASESSGGFDVTSTPGHPIVEQFAEGQLMPIITAIIMAAILAPIIEEIAFRGLLYRHLRDVSAKFRVSVSVLFSCLVNSFIFTIIHPQSWVGLFVLMPLALGFSLVREWRNNLIAPMAMHAYNNGAISVIMVLMVL